VVLVVSDTGIGIPEAKLAILKQLLSNGSQEMEAEGFGLRNVNERIKIYFGSEYGIRVDSEDGVGTEVQIVIPKVLHGEDDA
jgi:two-component system sensor histidine kinase YesM